MAYAFSSFATTFTNLNDNFNRGAIALDASNAELLSESFPGELELLRQQNNQLGQLVDAMPTGLIILDGDGVVIKANNVARKLLDEPILGQPWFEVIKRSFKPREDDWHEVSLKDGRRVKLEISALSDEPGQLIMITDLTETRLLQDKISKMKRLSSLGHMVSTLAHQIRTPLSAAILYGANLQNSQLNGANRERFQDKLNSRLQDLEQHVNDMLLFAKSGQEQVVTPLSINEVIQEAIQALDALIQEKSAKVTFSLCPHDCQILGNKRALMGAIQNLIHNSLAVIPNDAEIDVTGYCKDQYAFISVRDNGPGISSKLANKIFEPFYTTRAQGTGLGLAVVKSVATAHQGNVRLISQQGESAHFCMHLPRLISSKAQAKNQKSPRNKTSSVSPQPCQESSNDSQ